MAKCQTKYCRRDAKSRYCYRCEHERKKERNPYGYWFGVLRRNARRRGKHFALTFDYWVQWCNDTGYLAIKGRRANEASVDCIKNELGYIDGNIRPLTVGDNASKGTKHPQYNPVTRSWDIVAWTPPTQLHDLPF